MLINHPIVALGSVPLDVKMVKAVIHHPEVHGGLVLGIPMDCILTSQWMTSSLDLLLNNAGDLVGDFIFDQGDVGGELGDKVLHCRNAPSPAAISSLAIASLVVDKMENIRGFK